MYFVCLDWNNTMKDYFKMSAHPINLLFVNAEEFGSKQKYNLELTTAALECLCVLTAILCGASTDIIELNPHSQEYVII